MAKATKKPLSGKPKKPYESYPLFPHASGRWAKKIRGKLHYFGRWRAPNEVSWRAALDQYNEQAGDLHAGRPPRVTGDELTVRDLCNHFLSSKERQRDCGEIVNRTWIDYKRTCDRVVAMFGKSRVVAELAPVDFEQLKALFAATRGPVGIGNEITRTRVLFNFGFESGLLDKPMRYGPTFRKPGMRIVRKSRNGRTRMFEADDIHTILDACPDVHMRAMVLLGINCAMGNADCGQLEFRNLELESGWLDYPRPKTQVERRCPLWEETIEALRTSIERRRKPHDEQHSQLVFITRKGAGWHKDTNASPLSREFAKLLVGVGLYQNQLGFYGLRHSFRTISDERRDYPAIDMIMGHADQSMAAHYRERISDERLRAVTDHVHCWLFGGGGQNVLSRTFCGRFLASVDATDAR